MEVSSHALDLHRADGLDFDGAVFTNLSRDHLDYHHDMETYFASKARLFTDCLPASVKKRPFAVINADDTRGLDLARMAEEAGLATLTYGWSPDRDVLGQRQQALHGVRGGRGLDPGSRPRRHRGWTVPARAGSRAAGANSQRLGNHPGSGLRAHARCLGQGHPRPARADP